MLQLYCIKSRYFVWSKDKIFYSLKINQQLLFPDTDPVSRKKSRANLTFISGYMYRWMEGSQ